MIIGIDGLGGAGKTSKAKELQDILSRHGISSEILHIDDFIHPRDIRYVDNIEEWKCYYYLQWRYDYISDILKKLKQEGAFFEGIEIYNKKTDCYDIKTLKIKPETVLIIEGVFLQRKELKDLFDFVMYIDVPKEERLRRVLKRDTYIGNEREIEEKYKKRYFPAEDYYVKTCHPSKCANLQYDTIISFLKERDSIKESPL